MSIRNLLSISIALGIYAAGGGSAFAGSLVDTIGRADVVVAAEVTGGEGGPHETQFHLAVRTALKGALPGGEAEVYFKRAPDPRLGPFKVSTVCGVFFLRKDRDKWTVLPQSGPAPVFAFEDLYVPTDACSENVMAEDSAGALADSTERVLREYIRSVEKAAPQYRYMRTLFWGIRPRESAEVAAASRRFATSDKPGLRVLGLAWQIAEGDADALARAAANLTELEKSDAGLLLTLSIASYANPNPAGVTALGSIVSTGSDSLVQAASFALRSIHTRESLPSLRQLLDSRNPIIRQNARAGFEYFVMAVPPLTMSRPDDVIDRAMNPGTRARLDPDDEAHVRALRNATSEAEQIRLWKDWYAHRVGAGR